MSTKFIKLIRTGFLDQRANFNENKSGTLQGLIASSFIILSGAMLFTDKISTFGIEETFGFSDVQTMLWVLCQTLSPMFLCFGAMLKPYKFVYFVPLYFYFIQLYWVIYPDVYHLDDALLHVYAFGFCILVFVFLVFTLYLIKFLNKEKKVLIQNIKKLTRHIAITIKGKYIKEEDATEYTIETVKIIDSMD
ncbi:hypothetical protein BD809_10456 [Aquimarina intermedia]|uniref:Uncharacterized protein n=2 Tax=Aquimarina intermedia TaxID=350814 RepID=A0A5S5C6L0_9FLAO|nr:hypothetical protein BD809_10456 [Aquimarina intermedia]